jgi:hypothetical protein
MSKRKNRHSSGPYFLSFYETDCKQNEFVTQHTSLSLTSFYSKSFLRRSKTNTFEYSFIQPTLIKKLDKKIQSLKIWIVREKKLKRFESYEECPLFFWYWEFSFLSKQSKICHQIHSPITICWRHQQKTILKAKKSIFEFLTYYFPKVLGSLIFEYLNFIGSLQISLHLGYYQQLTQIKIERKNQKSWQLQIKFDGPCKGPLGAVGPTGPIN